MLSDAHTEALAAAAAKSGCPIPAQSVSSLVHTVRNAYLKPPRARIEPKVIQFGKVDVADNENDNEHDDGDSDKEAKEAVERSKHPELLMDPPESREDPYYWMRDDSRKSPEIRSFIRRENMHTQAVCKPLANTRKTLYKEMLSHVNETNTSFPYPLDNYLYYTRTVKGLSYCIYCRKAGPEAPEEVLLDVNKLAEGKDFCDVRIYLPGIVQDNCWLCVRRTCLTLIWGHLVRAYVAFWGLCLCICQAFARPVVHSYRYVMYSCAVEHSTIGFKLKIHVVFAPPHAH